MKATLRLKGTKIELECEDGQVIDKNSIGWVSEEIKTMYSHLPRVIKPVTEDDFSIILEEGGDCFVELEERRKMSSDSWDNAINSYSNDDDAWYHIIRTVDNKIVLHYN